MGRSPSKRKARKSNGKAAKESKEVPSNRQAKTETESRAGRRIWFLALFLLAFGGFFLLYRDKEDDPDVYYQYAMAYAHTPYSDGFISNMEKGIRLLKPEKRASDRAKWLNYLAMGYLERNDLHTSMETLEQSIQSDPAAPEGYGSMGGVLRMLGRTIEARDVLLRGEAAVIAKHGPKYHQLHLILQGLFHVYQNLGELETAYEYMRRAIELDPKPAYLVALADSLLENGRAQEGIELFDHALDLEPNHMTAFCLRAHAYAKVGEWELLERDNERLIQYMQSAIADRGRISQAGTCLQPYHATYMDISAELLLETAKLYASKEAIVSEGDRLPVLSPSDVAPLFDDSNNRLRKLRIGYVSSDLSQHPVGRNVLGMFMAHNKKKYEVFAFSTKNHGGDPITRVIEQNVNFVDISNVQDHAALARRIRDEYQIDVLIDLNGWTKFRRLELFAARPAPIQMTHGLGFVGTSGAANAFDYFITDSIASPARFDAFYAEKMIRLPQSYLPASHKTVKITGEAYNPGNVDKMQLRKDNGLTPDMDTFVFCSFQHIHKISHKAFNSWMRILQKSPSSVLWLTSVSKDVRKKLVDRAKDEFGIDANKRLIFGDVTAPGTHLLRAQACDLHLDSWPYNAHSTAVDTLFAGVPLLVYLPDYHDTSSENQVPKMCSRVSASLLHTIGLPQLITSSIEEFENEAVRLSTKGQAYNELRSELLSKREDAPLFDLISYARAHEKAYDSAFRLFQTGQQPRNLDVPGSRSGNQSQNERGRANDEL